MTVGSDLQARSAILDAARILYAQGPFRARTLQRLRPYICPFENLVRWVPPKARVLDVGCGAGLFLGLVSLAQPGVRAIGFDADADAIAAAQEMARTHFDDGRIDFRHSAVGDPWPNGLFDVVSLIDVLHHIPPAVQHDVIADAYAHVAPAGLLIYKDMAARSAFRAWWNRFHDIVVARQWINYRSIDDVENWLKGLGAEIVERSARNLGPYGHELVVAKKPT